MAAFVERYLETEPSWWYDPLSWNPDVPEAYSPSGFPLRIAEAVSACPQGYTVLDSDCSEPPCYAFLGNARSRDDWDGRECPLFVETFGGPGTSTLALSVPCWEGELWLLTIAPTAAVQPSLPPELADDYQLAMDRKIPRLADTLTPERLADLCARYFEINGGPP